MRTPTLVFDYIDRVATQIGKDPRADRKAAKTLATQIKGSSRAAGGRPSSSQA
jgi:hypothetical protein